MFRQHVQIRLHISVKSYLVPNFNEFRASNFDFLTPQVRSLLRNIFGRYMLAKAGSRLAAKFVASKIIVLSGALLSGCFVNSKSRGRNGCFKNHERQRMMSCSAIPECRPATKHLESNGVLKL